MGLKLWKRLWKRKLVIPFIGRCEQIEDRVCFECGGITWHQVIPCIIEDKKDIIIQCLSCALRGLIQLMEVQESRNLKILRKLKFLLNCSQQRRI